MAQASRSMNWCALLANPPLKELELTEHATPHVRSGLVRLVRSARLAPMKMSTSLKHSKSLMAYVVHTESSSFVDTNRRRMVPGVRVQPYPFCTRVPLLEQCDLEEPWPKAASLGPRY